MHTRYSFIRPPRAPFNLSVTNQAIVKAQRIESRGFIKSKYWDKCNGRTQPMTVRVRVPLPPRVLAFTEGLLPYMAASKESRRLSSVDVVLTPTSLPAVKL